MRLTIGHRYDFRADREEIGSDLIRPEAWDAARGTSGAFRLPESRFDWELLAKQPQLEKRATDLVAIARRLGAGSLCSHGAGTGALELNIHRLAPDLVLTCTDYAPRATERLARLFPEAVVIAHDLAREEPPEADVHVMHRIDTELDTRTWQQVFARFHEPVVVVPTLLLGAERVLKEVALRLFRPRASRAGWIRTEDAFRALWSATHVEETLWVGDQRSFLLTPR